MTSKMFKIRCLFSVVILSTILVQLIIIRVDAVEENTCKWNTYNFESLNINQAPWISRNDDNSTEYLISLCQPLSTNITGCNGNDTAICQVSADGNGLSIGKFFSALEDVITEDSGNRKLQAILDGDKCPSSVTETMKTIIEFRCGKTLGVPKFLESYGCVVYFEWQSSVACRTSSRVSETRCYIYDKQKKLIDLTPLIKSSGNYSISRDDDDDDDDNNNNGDALYINVCREIPASDANSCQGRSSCLVHNNTFTGVGHLVAPLGLSGDGYPYITYVESNGTRRQDCTTDTTTTITFHCPERGKGSPPVLVSNTNCQYRIDWETEYACPEESLSSATCKLTQSQHNVDFDLTALSKSNPYSVEGKDQKGTVYGYLLNICSKDGVNCSGNQIGVASCQSTQSGDKKWSLGQVAKQKLRYSDGQLSLTYDNGDACSNGYHRTTVINFNCNASAGAGSPVFAYENSCSYIFDWDTALACSVPPVECKFTHSGQMYDLSRLIKTDGNWRVSDDASVVINVCHNLVRDEETKNCSERSAICQLDGDKSISLGSISGNSAFDSASKNIQLNYTDGDVCDKDGKQRHSSTITFRCLPGIPEGKLTKTGISVDGCHHEFVWYTAAACVQNHLIGQDCRIEDTVSALSFDLSPLTKATDKPNANYKVENLKTDHEYYINVCDVVKGTPCDGKEGIALGAGVCQQAKKDIGNVHNTGQANGALHFFNGVLKLVYEGGDKYHSEPPIARRTEIEFLCDAAAGLGQPRFVTESNRTYNIEWHTSLACPSEFSECKAVDEENNQKYDLSKLSHSESEGNWIAEMVVDGSKKLKFYINVCRPVVSLGSSQIMGTCEGKAGICVTQLTNGAETVTIANLGRSLSGPKVVNPGQLSLDYILGNECPENKTIATSALLELICNPSFLTSGPSLVEQIDTCRYRIQWETAYACPLVTTNGTAQCRVTDDVIGHTYDLTTLSSKNFYVNNTAGQSFWLGICNFSSSCGVGVSVCDIEKKPLGYFANSSLKLEKGSLQLLYRGPDGSSTRLDFLCNSAVAPGQESPTFVREEAKTYFFEVQTSLACSSYAMDCQTFDESGNKYDLSPLMKSNDNWVITDPYLNKYYINVCGSIKAINDTNCRGNTVGGCQITNLGTAYNMGHILGRLEAAADGTLTIRYTGGDICHLGTTQAAYRSTRILFYCSTIEHDPIFKEETDTCEYVIEWRTPFACPLKHVEGRDCKVDHPLYSWTFDLQSLKKTGSEDYDVVVGGKKFMLNVCDRLHSESGKDNACSAENVGACVVADNKFANIGNRSDKLQYDDGILKLVYTGDKANCNDRTNSTTTIDFTCEHGNMGITSGPSYLPESSTPCRYHLEWPTSLACMPFSQSECSITDSKGNTYDLSDLTLHNDNYESDTPDGLRYVINVCSTLVHSKGVLCPPNSAACLINRTATTDANKYKSIGQMSEHVLTMIGDSVQLTYENGADCGGGRKSKTIVEFQCDLNAAEDTKPEYMVTESGCNHMFSWSTRVVCSQTNVTSNPGNCTVIDPSTGHVFDLAPLSRTNDYTAMSPDNKQAYHLSVCRSLVNSSCGKDTGSCQTEMDGSMRSFDAGKFNSLLTINDGILSLKYSGGEVCRHNNRSRSSIINFACASTGGLNQPQFIKEDDDCTYFFSWHTSLACRNEIRCMARSSSIDLSSLIKLDGYHSVEVDATKDSNSYYINICRPLSTIEGKQCSVDAAVCREDGDGNLMSLGSLNEEPVYNESSGVVTLTYVNGSACTKPNMRWSSVITFTCLSGQELSAPRFISKDEEKCEYHFQWPTTLVCSSKPLVLKDCIVTDSTGQYKHNLTDLWNTVKDKEIESRTFASDHYTISFCGGSLPGICQASSVCRMKSREPVQPFGTTSSMTLVPENSLKNSIKIAYKHDSGCADRNLGKPTISIGESCVENIQNLVEICSLQNEQTSAAVYLVCEEDNIVVRPEIYFEDKCSVVFYLYTSAVCVLETKLCKLSHGGNNYDLSPLSRYNYTTFESDGYKYWVNLCKGVQDAPKECGVNTAMCRFNQIKKEYEILAKTKSEMMLIEDDRNVVVEYSRQSHSSMCQGKVRIVFLCSETNGEPVVKSQSDCLLTLEWRTSVVCNKTGDHSQHVASVPTVSSTTTSGQTLATQNETMSKQESTARPSSGRLAVVVVLGVFVILVAALLVVVFRHRIRQKLLGYNSVVPSFVYSKLSGRDSEEGVGLLNRSRAGNIQHYESDDDMLL